MKKIIKVKIGIIASITGSNSKVGQGMLDSAMYMLARKSGRLEKKGMYIELIHKDDNSDSFSSATLAKDLVNEDCIAIIGPTDSLSLREILLLKSCENIPIITSIASASYLSTIGASNFFRFTTPDFIRAEILVRYVRRIYPSSLVYVGGLEGSEFSYGQQLKKDVIYALEKYNIKWTAFDFRNDNEITIKPVNNEPLIACGPSSSVVSLAKLFRKNKIRSQFFSFGSNTNFLDDALENTIVVCDLDRADVNPVARDEIEHFNVKYPNNNNPDLSTMNAVFTLCNLMLENSDSILKSELPLKRFQLLNVLKNGVHKALLGQISFSESGEMAGHENISVLRVTKNKNKFKFCQLERDERALLQDNHWWKNRAILILSIIGSIASTASLVYVFL